MRKSALGLALAVAALATLPACQRESTALKTTPLLQAYGTQQDWNNPDHLITLNYQETQGKRIFNEKCVWCHGDSTPAGPSNRSNLNPAPPLINDGATLNPLGDAYLENVITLGGAAMGKSAIMPPWGRTLSQEEIRALVAYIRAVAQPRYRRPAQPGPKYSAR